MKKLSKVFASLIATVAILVNLLPISTLMTLAASWSGDILTLDCITDFTYDGSAPGTGAWDVETVNAANGSDGQYVRIRNNKKATSSSVNFATSGIYSISVYAWCPYATLATPIFVDGEEVGSVSISGASTFKAFTLDDVVISAGSHTIGFQCGNEFNSGYDYVTVELKSSGSITTYEANAGVVSSCSSMGTATVAKSSGGTGAASQTINENGKAYYVATPASGYQFVKWVATNNASAQAVSTSASYTATITAATTLYAVFEESVQYTVSTAANNAAYGSVTGAGTVYEGNSTTLTATANTGYQFSYWSTDGGTTSTSTANPLVVTPTANVTYTAVFEVKSTTNTLTMEIEDYVANYNSGNQPTVGTALAGYSGTGYAALNNNGSKQYIYVPFTAPANATYSFAITYATASSSDIYIDRFDSTSGSNYGQQTYNGNTYYHNAYAGIGGGSSSSWSTNSNASSVTNISLTAGQTILVGLTDNSGRAYFDKIVVTASSDVFTPPVTTYEITTSVNNASYGLITATASYNEGSNVTLTATPASGYRVQKWVVDSVDVASTAATYTINSIAAAHTVQVVFEVIPAVTYEVTTSVNNAGYGSITATASYNEGTNVTLTATPAEGCRVQKWIVDDSDVASTSTTYTINSIAAAHTVQAIFETIPQYTVSAAANNATYGSVTGAGTVYEGNTVTLTATPASGYGFTGWSTDGGANIVSTINPLTVTPTVNVTYTAVFEVKSTTNTLTMEIEDYVANYNSGNQPTVGTALAGYSGTGYAALNNNGSKQYIYVPFTAPANATYSFAITYATASSSDIYIDRFDSTSGSNYGQQTYNGNTYYHNAYAGIGGGSSSSWSTNSNASSVTNISLTAGQTILVGLTDNSGRAYFDKIVVTASSDVFTPPVTTYSANAAVATSCSTMGTATVAATSGGAGLASQTIAENGSAYYVATANNGYHFVKWTATDDATATAVSTNASYTAIITGDTTLYAVFEVAVVSTVTAAVELASGCASMGTVTVASTDGGEGLASQEIAQNGYAYYVAVANDGYKFVKWVATNDANAQAVSTDASYATQITDDITLYAVFTNAQAYTISTAVNNAEYGSVSEGGIVYENGSITLTATAVSGYIFSYWSADGGVTSASTANPLTITNPTSNVTYTAVFEITYDRTISAAVASACKNGGTVTVATTSGGEGGVSQVITLGNNAYFVATASTGYAFVKWVATDDANAEAVSTSASYTMQAITGDAVLYAVFVPTAICQDSNTVKVFFENSNLNYNNWTVKDTKYTGSSATFYNADGTVNFYDNSVEIKGRGNYTWTSVQPDGKKPFQVKFSSKVQPLGLGDGATKTWIFLANVADQSLLRNYAAFYFADQLSGLSNAEIDGFISDAETVEVWINGNYYGVYLLCEKCETGKTRINVPEPEAAEETEFGFLVERDYYATSEDTGTWFTVDGVNYTIKSDIVFDETAPDAANNAQNTIIKNYIAAVNSAIKGQDETTIRSLIDVNSFVDMYIAQEFVKNCDVGYSSFYMYTDSVTSGKLFLGPVWDFDIALGNNDKFDEGLATGLYAGMSLAEYNAASGNYKSQANEWFIYLLDTEWFKELVTARWSELRGQNIVENTISAVTTSYNQNREAFIHNFDKWGYPTSPTNAEPDYILALAHPGNDNINHVNNLNTWIANRASYLDTVYYDISSVDENGNTRYVADLEFEAGTATGTSVIVDGTNGNDPATFLVEGAMVSGWSSNGYTYVAAGGDGAYVTFTTPTFGENATGSENFILTAYAASNYNLGQQLNYFVYEGEGTTGNLVASGNTTAGYLTVFRGDLVVTAMLSSNTTYTFYVEAPAGWGHVALDKLKVVSSTNIVSAVPETVTAVVVTDGDAEDATGGSVNGATGPYYYNNTVTLTATANTGYIFTGWYDVATGGTALSTEAAYSFTIKENTTVYARFAEGYVVTTTAYSDKITTNVMAADAEAGTFTGANTYFSGTEVTIKATPAVGYTFVNWTDASGTVLSTNASYTFQMNTYNMDFKANFKYVGSYTFSVETGNGGTVSGTATGTYNKGHNVSLMAVPVGAATFAKWQIWNGNEYVDYSTERTITFALNSDTIIKAVYDLALATSTTYEWEEAYAIGTDTSFYSADGAYVVGTWTSDDITWSNNDFVYLKTTRVSYAVLEVDLRGTTEAADYTFTTYGSSPDANGKSVWINIYKDVYTEHDSIDRQYIGAYTICASATESVGTPILLTGLEPGIYYFEIVSDGSEFCLDKLVVSADTDIVPEHTVKTYEAFTVSGNIMSANSSHSTPYCEIVIPKTQAGLDQILNAGLTNYDGAKLYDAATWENGVDVNVVYTINGVEYTGTATISMVLGALSGNKYTANSLNVSAGATSKLQLSWDENGTVSYVALTLDNLDPSLVGETALITINRIVYRTQPIVDLTDKGSNMIIRGDEVPNASAGPALGYTDANGASWMAISTVIDPEDSFEHRVWKIDYSLDTANPNEYGVYAGVYRAIQDLSVNAEDGKGFSFWYRTPENDTTGMTLNFCMQSNLYPPGAEGQPMYVYLEPTYGDWKPMYVEYDLVGSYDGATIRYWDVFVNYDEVYADGTSHTMTESDGTFWLSELRIEKEEQVGVTYRNYTGQVLRYQMIDKNSITTPPEYMLRQEYTFVGWNLDTTATIYEVDTEAFTNHFSAGVTENRVYTAVYELSGHYYKIDVVNGAITNLNNAGDVKKAKLLYSRYIILTAGEYDSKDPTKTEFQYWMANNEIISYTSSFSTAVMGQTVYKAVFAELPYTDAKNATNIYDRVTVYDEEHLKSKNTITFNCGFTYDSDNYTVKAFGVLVTNEKAVADLSGTANDIMILSLGEAQSIVSASTNTGTLTRSYESTTKYIQWCKFTGTLYWDITIASGLYTIKLANLSNGVSRYAVSYLVLEDNTTHELSVYLSSDSGETYRYGTISAVS